MTRGAVSLTGLTKTFGDEVAVDGIDLDIGPGEFFSLLGPSGCGKTTTLRMIAGFEQPDSGTIRVDGRSLAEVPPHKRPVNTVFQSYALFPFLTVEDNVAFGLRYQRTTREEARRRVVDALEHVQMGGYAKRKPFQLSGGQQQRVALARALVLEPMVLLLDEPMGALDAKLRKQLQIELRSLQQEIGTTFVYVTHDQEEALTMSDRLAVMHQGRVMQVGTPSEVYSQPASSYVASFLGSTNLFPATVTGVSPDGLVCRVRSHELAVSKCEHDPAVGDEVSVMVRPERVEVSPIAGGGRGDADHEAANVLSGQVEALVFRGAHTGVILDCDGLRLEAEVPNHRGEPPEWLVSGSTVHARVSPTALRVLVS
ncbi:ABC transporter ATP-binding protein [Nocardioides guangzhouensis]|uniref:Spermidine/putrescine import ATP-binding protein PotA n=1 Tax=Nocardioides guangzhouensis TaxID=2497878 RepID=A0A4Q4ZKM2_9ACTN|nr:ABC transporter ATP-binding protein [Nocardioides guangzhouensis]RYP88056.1 ABC transporter ATP-binding protein [Nocardioides guangzhouensis]